MKCRASHEFEKVMSYLVGDYSTQTAKNYIFLDYRYAPEDGSLVVGYYKGRPIYVLFKDEIDKEKFNEFEFVPAGPIRTYRIESD